MDNPKPFAPVWDADRFIAPETIYDERGEGLLEFCTIDPDAVDAAMHGAAVMAWWHYYVCTGYVRMIGDTTFFIYVLRETARQPDWKIGGSK